MIKANSKDKELKILDEALILVPCAKKDFEKVDALAESYLIVRHLNESSYIRVERKKILWKVNP